MVKDYKNLQSWESNVQCNLWHSFWLCVLFNNIVYDDEDDDDADDDDDVSWRHDFHSTKEVH